jgi:hypothetical protein
MLSDMTPVAALPTADLSRARDFHEGHARIGPAT